jgi:DNA-binding NarL/FixJ family response regulator
VLVVGRTVLVVDDHDGFRSEARELLSADGFSVVGEAADCATGLSETRRLKPDVVLLDIGLPDGSGLDLVPRLRESSPKSQIVLVSARHEADYGGRIIAARAEAFLEKASLREGTLEAVLARTR